MAQQLLSLDYSPPLYVPDFNQLATKYPSIVGPCLIEKTGRKDHRIVKRYHVDWSSETALRILTETLLFEEFQLRIQLREDRLCPPLPNRLLYVDWLNELLHQRENFKHENPSEASFLHQHDVCVLDVGTGASAIYPLLGFGRCGWRFIGSDVDPSNLHWAQQNLSQNVVRRSQEGGGSVALSLGEAIKLVHCSDSSELQFKISQLLSPERPLTATAMDVSSADEDHPAEKEEEDSSDEEADASSDLDEKRDLVPAAMGNVAAHQILSQASQKLLMVPVSSSVCPPRGPIRQALIATGLQEVGEVVERCEHIYFERLLGDTTCSSRPDKHVDEPNPLSAASLSGRQPWLPTATMCNPPFYDYSENVTEFDGRVCTGCDTEMKTHGGEVAFVLAMVLDALVLGKCVPWYTTMIGKKSSYKLLLKVLRSTKVIPTKQPAETTSTTVDVVKDGSVLELFQTVAEDEQEQLRESVADTLSKYGISIDILEPENGSTAKRRKLPGHDSNSLNSEFIWKNGLRELGNTAALLDSLLDVLKQRVLDSLKTMRLLSVATLTGDSLTAPAEAAGSTSSSTVWAFSNSLGTRISTLDSKSAAPEPSTNIVDSKRGGEEDRRQKRKSALLSQDNQRTRAMTAEVPCRFEASSQSSECSFHFVVRIVAELSDKNRSQHTCDKLASEQGDALYSVSLEAPEDVGSWDRLRGEERMLLHNIETNLRNDLLRNNRRWRKKLHPKSG